MNTRLPIRMVAKPWGKASLPAPFVAPQDQRIGEIWFEPPAQLDQLLIKYIFTSEALSVQVHPSDAQCAASGLHQSGKEECWLVIDAEPGARLGIGFKEEVSPAAIHAAALDGTIEQMLAWFPVAPGDFFHIPANTVHVIGAGVSLVEVQQHSDVTYRLYDYGRPRELHLAEGVAVASGQRHPAELRRRVADEPAVRLVDGPHFRLDHLAGTVDPGLAKTFGSAPLLVIPLAGEARIAGEPIGPGECAMAAAIADLTVPEGCRVLVAQPCQAGMVPAIQPPPTTRSPA